MTNTETLKSFTGETLRLAPKRAGEAIDYRFFSRFAILRHERPGDFQTFLLEINRSYEPRSRAEEFTVFRMAQDFWLLRRLDSAEEAVYDALAEMAKKRYARVTDACAAATFFLKPDESPEAAFFRRMLDYRAMREKTLHRLTGQLIPLKTYREAAELRALQADAIRSKALPATGIPHRGRFGVIEFQPRKFQASET